MRLKKLWSCDELTKQADKQVNKQSISLKVSVIILFIGAPINKAKLAKYRRQEFQIKDTTLSANVSNYTIVNFDLSKFKTKKISSNKLETVSEISKLLLYGFPSIYIVSVC